MRIAVVSDVHGSLVALEAVVADLERRAPDLIVQGGDTAVLGPRPAEVVDRLRELGWPSVAGNTDQMLWDPGVRAVQERRAPGLASWLGVLFGTLGPWAAERLGAERIAWLRSLPLQATPEEGVRVVHASPGDLWRAPMPDAGDDELAAVYGDGGEVTVYGHIHRPFVRALPRATVANCGSVGLPWDGDPRASYLLVEAGRAQVRRVPYDLDRARRDLADAGFPLADWLASVQREARFTRPA